MAEHTVYCEECVEDIPANEVYWDEGRLYCSRCGSEVESPDRDIFEEIVDNRSAFLFRDDDLASQDEVEEDDEDEDEETEAEDEDGEPDAEGDGREED
ncbi:MAG TPA: hypothetical protein VKB51_11610 [bacterium]|nr:hypothetical protein [bacterium]